MKEDNKTTYRITDLDVDERPRERLMKYGANVLADAELLAILLRVGVEGENVIQLSKKLLKKYGGFTGLHRANIHDLELEHGLGPAKIAQLKAALEIGERLRRELKSGDNSIHSPQDAADLLQHEMSILEQEELRVILLDTRNRVQEVETVYRGSLNSSQVRVGELFRSAIRRNAAAVIIAHNHPSGDPTPSPDDVAVTRAFIQAGKLLDVEVLDHMVIGLNRWVSLKERGLGFS
jgi:DNA repair protein RadC